VGQTLHVGPWSAEVILITDPEHAVPVQIERNGLRTIAVGAGDTASLALPYLPGNADVKAGDLLLTSGLGGVFPAGYPVARITEVHRDAVQPLAQVVATPLGRVDLDREVMLVWFREDHPAAPGSATMGEATKGNPSMRPQPAPPKPPAPTATAAPATPGTVSGGATSGAAAIPGAVPSGAAKPTASPPGAAPSAPKPAPKAAAPAPKPKPKPDAEEVE
jgi:rod shape-determining protein MreC